MSTWREVPFALTPDLPRVGIHWSDITKDLLLTIDSKKYGKGIDDVARNKFERGYALEDMLKRRSWGPDVLTQIEFVDDDIIHTLDGFNPLIELVLESKCTAYSMGKGLHDTTFISWNWQTCGYQRVSRAVGVRLDVMWVNGDYRPMQTEMKSYRRRFTTNEMSETWDMVRRHRDRMVRDGKLPVKRNE